MTRRSVPGDMRKDDPDIWLRQLDYYAKLHELNDQCVGHVLSALDDIDAWENTIIVFTSDHGDQCGSHNLRSKGPWKIAKVAFSSTDRMCFKILNGSAQCTGKPFSVQLIRTGRKSNIH